MRSDGSSSSDRIGKALVKAFRHLVRWTGLTHRVTDIATRLDRVGAVDRQNQILLMLNYRDRALRGMALPSFADVEFRSFSQNGEDGILLYIFALIGMQSRRCVEICASDGIECNSANLIINHGFDALLFEGRERKVALGRRFYRKCRETALNQPTFVHTWITRDAIDGLIREHGFAGEVDLLSLDLDGMDYWVWEAIECLRPRVAVVEFNGTWNADHPVVVPYRDDFRRTSGYSGASLAAFTRLARQRGMRLVGCQRRGFNAFFVADGCGDELLPEVPVASCLSEKVRSPVEHTERLEAEEWVTV